MSQKSYVAGSEFPALEDGKLRLYSSRFDPLAQRARLVLAAKKIPYETININLVKKPDWFVERNPTGTVPVVEHSDGKAVYESMIVCEYLDSLYPDNKLIPADPYVRARQQIIFDAFTRVTAAYYKIVRSANPETVTPVTDLNKSLEYFEKSLSGSFFGGDSPALVDYCMWPIFERFAFLKVLVEYELDAKAFPKLSAWIDRMKKQPAVKETATNINDLHEFHKSYVAGHPDYDVGL